MKRKNKLAKTLLPLGAGALFVVFASPGSNVGASAVIQSPPADSTNWDYSRRGIDLLMDGDTDGAINVFRQVQQNDPQSPLGYLLEAQAMWWKIYYATADLLDPDVFDVARKDSSPLDFHFNDLTNVAIHRAELHLREEKDVARSNLYEGMAYALLARLDGLRGKDLGTARAGKKMRTFLMTALKLDPNLVDANLGLGIYNYYIDTLPPAIKVLRVLGNVPGGNRQLGLHQIQQAATQGDLLKEEAKFYLAKDYSHESEGKYRDALELFQKLAGEHPRNALWPLLSAAMHLRLGEVREGDALYREVLKDTKGKNSETDQAVHRAAREGLAKLHPAEKIGD